MAITGDNNKLKIMGDLIVGVPPRVHRSSYLLEVRHLAATQFEGRQEELAAMAVFAAAPNLIPTAGNPAGMECARSGKSTGQGGSPAKRVSDRPLIHVPYWRWEGEAWTGKTALMVEFVLNPPANVDVLAFFITARTAGRADRTAFLSALEGQLRAYLHDGDVDCSDLGQLHDAVFRATARATERDRRLVLVVDGLDEDTGVIDGASGYSIAALLPGTAPPGLRVIVAGRPNPPVPSDVPGDHPLRTTAIDHQLPISETAKAVRADAERNLQALVAGGGLGLDLVGLTAASGGGLSAGDLAALTGRAVRQVELVLDGSVGRSFQRRPARWATAPDGAVASVLSFAHQALAEVAMDLLSPTSLSAYQARIHAYIDQWREEGWPATTPEYALIGYPEAVRLTTDTSRL
ncbi:hypothetical protein ACFQ7Y_42360, partial [Streptomyces sp. NPDC056512]